MNAAILSIGDELILGQIAERNAGWISARLAEQGVMTEEHRTVPDDLDAITDALRELTDACEIVITTGGLGPTDDDLLRPALARLLGETELVEDAQARSQVEAWFSGRHRPMPLINLRQAQRPARAKCLHNRHGTAPGLAVQHGRCRIWSLPGPPAEMHPMFEHFIAPTLLEGCEREALRLEAIPCFGLGESAIAERLGDLMARDRNPLVGTTASGQIVTIRLRARGAAAADAAGFDAFVEQIMERVHPYALSVGASTLPEAFAKAAQSEHATVALAESCTAGLASAMLGEVPGASSWFKGSVVSYANEVKEALLGVPSEMIRSHGAVSVETARRMVTGVMRSLGANTAASITGVAGPDGGSKDKPVGTVIIATAVHSPDAAIVRHFRFQGDRAAIRERAARSAIGALLLHLRGAGPVPLLGEVAPAR